MINNDILYKIIEINFHPTDIQIRRVSKTWRNTLDEILISKYKDLKYIFTKIANNQIYDLSFEYCHNLIYNHCLQKTESIVLLIASYIFKSYELDIGQAILASKTFSNICLYLNKLKFNYYRKQNIHCSKYSFRFSYIRLLKKIQKKKKHQ